MSTSAFEILAYEPSPLGMLCLRRRELLREPGRYITEITLNHEFLMSSYNTLSERRLSEIAIEMHGGSDLKVLIGGLGLGYTANAVLKYEKIQKIEVIEFLPQVIDWLERGLIPLAEDLNGDPRLSVTEDDFYTKLLGTPETLYDLILVDIDHSPKEHLNLEEGNDLFYTEAGLAQAKKHLAPKGIFGIWSYAESSSFSEALKNVFREVRVEKVEFHNNLVDEHHTDWLFFARD